MFHSLSFHRHFYAPLLVYHNHGYQFGARSSVLNKGDWRSWIASTLLNLTNICSKMELPKIYNTYFLAIISTVGGML